MAPRRNNSLTGSGSALDVHISLLAGLTDSTEHLDTAGAISHHNQSHHFQQQQQQQQQNHHHQQQPLGGHRHTNSQSSVLQLCANDLGNNYTRCCVPAGDCFKASGLDFGFINLDVDQRDCVRVLCNNENCTAGQFMHRECFDAWEQGVLTYLKSIGRARSWSERQRQQNLWTKKGYDLVFKACGCKCGRGHLKKDLDWSPPMSTNIFGRIDEDACSSKKGSGSSGKGKKQRNRNGGQKGGVMAVGSAVGGMMGTFHVPSVQQGLLGIQSMGGNGVSSLMCGDAMELRHRAGSLSSSTGSTSPPASGSSDHSISPVHHQHQGQFEGAVGGACGGGALVKRQKSKVEAYSDRVRTTSGCNGIFSRRLDFSTFNMLPKTRLNSYQIKMEDEGNHGNDETRLFILSSLAQHQKSRVACILCEESMLVFDRYPLVDGTFFLSPKQHSKGCIEVKYDGQTQYLTAVCMGCLEGVSADRIIRCRFCAQKWEGSSLVLGTMYAYDIFAAMPCCTERLKCNICYKLLLYPHHRLNFYSDYSHVVSCVHCSTQDTHFVKPLSFCYTKQPLQAYQQWP